MKTNWCEITNEDNMELMARYPDNHFDLAIVDPPYGIGESSNNNQSRSRIAKSKNYGAKTWDDAPPSDTYFKELLRASKDQIVWGANHIFSKNSTCWIVWDKQNGKNDFADCELAYTSFDTAVRKFQYRWHGMLQKDMKNKEVRIHPTQKPVALYEWLFKNYAKPGQKILDTHLGSGSIAIALDRVNKIEGMNLHLTACELDKDYYQAAIKRIQDQTNWQPVFEEKREEPKQTEMF